MPQCSWILVLPAAYVTQNLPGVLHGVAFFHIELLHLLQFVLPFVLCLPSLPVPLSLHKLILRLGWQVVSQSHRYSIPYESCYCDQKYMVGVCSSSNASKNDRESVDKSIKPTIDTRLEILSSVNVLLLVVIRLLGLQVGLGIVHRLLLCGTGDFCLERTLI